MTHINENKQSVVILRGKLERDQRNRLGRLLDMMYSPSELAEEIGFSARQVARVYIQLGCPHEVDQGHKLWINGKRFREWYLANYQKRPLKPDEVFCLSCKQAVQMNDPVLHRKGQISYYLCHCPHCDRKLSRIISKDRLLP